MCIFFPESCGFINSRGDNLFITYNFPKQAITSFICSVNVHDGVHNYPLKYASHVNAMKFLYTIFYSELLNDLNFSPTTLYTDQNMSAFMSFLGV